MNFLLNKMERAHSRNNLHFEYIPAEALKEILSDSLQYIQYI